MIGHRDAGGAGGARGLAEGTLGEYSCVSARWYDRVSDRHVTGMERRNMERLNKVQANAALTMVLEEVLEVAYKRASAYQTAHGKPQGRQVHAVSVRGAAIKKTQEAYMLGLGMSEADALTAARDDVSQEAAENVVRHAVADGVVGTIDDTIIGPAHITIKMLRRGVWCSQRSLWAPDELKADDGGAGNQILAIMRGEPDADADK